MKLYWHFAILFIAAGLLPTSLSARSIRISDFSESELGKLKLVENPDRTVVYINRGFPAEGLPKLTEFAWIQEIRMDISETSVTDLSPFSKLEALREIEVRGDMGQTPLDISPLNGLKQLTSINIISHRVAGGSRNIALPALEVLRIQRGEIDSLDFLKAAPKLRFLDLGNTKIDDNSLAALTGLKYLRSLDISQNESLKDADIQALAQIPMLLRIDVSRCSDLRSLDFLANQSELDVVDAAYCQQLASASALENKTKLSELNLSNTSIADFDFLKTCTSLSELNLGRTDIADTSVLAPLHWLKEVRLSRTKVSEINGLKNKVILNDISLYDTQVSDISALAASVHLENINLKKTQVTNLDALMHSNRLESLGVEESIDFAEIAPLRERMPQLRVN